MTMQHTLKPFSVQVKRGNGSQRQSWHWSQMGRIVQSLYMNTIAHDTAIALSKLLSLYWNGAGRFDLMVFVNCNTDSVWFWNILHHLNVNCATCSKLLQCPARCNSATSLYHITIAHVCNQFTQMHTVSSFPLTDTQCVILITTQYHPLCPFSLLSTELKDSIHPGSMSPHMWSKRWPWVAPCQLGRHWRWAHHLSTLECQGQCGPGASEETVWIGKCECDWRCSGMMSTSGLKRIGLLPLHREWENGSYIGMVGEEWVRSGS